jgi:hypothetical protein
MVKIEKYTDMTYINSTGRGVMGFSEPPEEIRAYAEMHGLEGLNLKSSIVQRMLHLRMHHPEWEREKAMKEQEVQRWKGKSILCIDQFIQVGRVEKIEGGILTLALADQFQEAAKWVHNHYFKESHPDRGIFSLPDLPFELTYEKAEQKSLAVYWQSIELAKLPENWVVSLYNSVEDMGGREPESESEHASQKKPDQERLRQARRDPGNKEKEVE